MVFFCLRHQIIPPTISLRGKSFCYANTNTNALPQASVRGCLGTCIIGDSRRYPWLFECWDCGGVGDFDVDNETIAVGDDVKKNTTSNHEGEGGGGRERYSGNKGITTLAKGVQLSCLSTAAAGGGRRWRPPPQQRVRMTLTTTTTKQMSRSHEQGRTLMGEGDNDSINPLALARAVVGVVRCQCPRWEDNVIQQRDEQGRGDGGFHIQKSTKKWQQ